MLEGKVIELKPKKVFSHQDIGELLPIVLRITKHYSEQVNQMIQRLDRISNNEKLVAASETEINELIQEWQVKMEKLGGQTKGLWIADFDSGDGYYCWKFPEAQILYWHGYRDGFSGRRPVKEYLNSKQETFNESGIGPDQHTHL